MHSRVAFFLLRSATLRRHIGNIAIDTIRYGGGGHLFHKSCISQVMDSTKKHMYFTKKSVKSMTCEIHDLSKTSPGHVFHKSWISQIFL